MQRRSLGCEDGQHLYFVRPGNTLRQVLSLFVKVRLLANWERVRPFCRELPNGREMQWHRR